MSFEDDEDWGAQYDFGEEPELEDEADAVEGEVLDPEPEPEPARAPEPQPARESTPRPPVRATNLRAVPSPGTPGGQVVGLLGVVTEAPILAAVAAGAAGWYLAPKRHRVPVALGCVIGGYVLAAWVLPRLLVAPKGA